MPNEPLNSALSYQKALFKKKLPKGFKISKGYGKCLFPSKLICLGFQQVECKNGFDSLLVLLVQFSFYNHMFSICTTYASTFGYCRLLGGNIIPLPDLKDYKEQFYM